MRLYTLSCSVTEIYFSGAIGLQMSTLGSKPVAPPRSPLPSVCSFDETATFIESDAGITRKLLNSSYCENRNCECPKSSQR